MKNKRVYQFSLDRKFIRSYASTSDAARAINIRSASNIIKNAKNQRKSAYNYIWSYSYKLPSAPTIQERNARYIEDNKPTSEEKALRRRKKEIMKNREKREKLMQRLAR